MKKKTNRFHHAVSKSPEEWHGSKKFRYFVHSKNAVFPIKYTKAFKLVQHIIKFELNQILLCSLKLFVIQENDRWLSKPSIKFDSQNRKFHFKKAAEKFAFENQKSFTWKVLMPNDKKTKIFKSHQKNQSIKICKKLSP